MKYITTLVRISDNNKTIINLWVDTSLLIPHKAIGFRVMTCKKYIAHIKVYNNKMEYQYTLEAKNELKFEIFVNENKTIY